MDAGDPRTKIETEPSLTELLEQVRSGSKEAVEQIVRLYHPHVLRAVRQRLGPRLRTKVGSSDFAQMVWQSVCERPDALARCPTPDELMAYLVAIAQRQVAQEARSYLHTAKRELAREEPLGSRDLVEVLASHAPTPSEVCEWRDEIAALLKDKPKAVHRMIELALQDYDCTQISQKLGIARRKVRKILVSLKLHA